MKEVLACGKPVVVNDVGDLAEYVIPGIKHLQSACHPHLFYECKKIINFVRNTMNTTSYKRTYSLPFSFEDILKLIKSFSIEDKVRLEKELEKETLVFRAKKLSERIKKNDLTIEDVVTEVSAYRKTKNAK